MRSSVTIFSLPKPPRTSVWSTRSSISAPRRCSPSPPERSCRRFQPSLILTLSGRFRGCECGIIVYRILITTSFACFALGAGGGGGGRALRNKVRRAGSPLRNLLGLKVRSGELNEQSRRQRFEKHPLLLVLRQEPARGAEAYCRADRFHLRRMR